MSKYRVFFVRYFPVFGLNTDSFFFSIRVFFHGHWRLTGQKRKEGDHLFIPFYHFHPLTNIQTFIRNFAYEIYLPDCYSMRSNCHLIDWWCDVNICLFTWRFDSRFFYSNLTRETGGLKFASTITLVFQTNRLTKCASHPKSSVLVTPNRDSYRIFSPKTGYYGTEKTPHSDIFNWVQIFQHNFAMSQKLFHNLLFWTELFSHCKYCMRI